MKYTLMIDNNPYEKLTKVSLHEIDKFTTQFEDEYDLIEELNNQGIYNVKNIKINYRYNGIQETDVAYKDKEDLQKIEFSNGVNIREANHVYIKYVNIFCEKIFSNQIFYKIASESRLFNDKIREYINLYHQTGDSFHKERLKHHLINYKQFRAILFILEEYEWLEKGVQINDSDKTKKEEYDDFDAVVEHRDEKEEFYTLEELKEYNYQIESVPEYTIYGDDFRVEPGSFKDRRRR